MSSDLRSLAELERWMDRTCPTCQGARWDGMGNPPCPTCNGMSKSKPDPPRPPDPRIGMTPEERRAWLKGLWTDEAAADLEAFHGRR